MRRYAQVGFGAIAGEADGIVTIDNVPGRAEIRVFRRVNSAYLARQFSANNGTYYFKGLEANVEHDVIARDPLDAWEDVIAGRVLPFKPLRLLGDAPNAGIGVPYSHTYTIDGGEGPYTVLLTGTLPDGLAFSSTADTATISGTASVGALPATFSVAVTDARSATAAIVDDVAVVTPVRYWRISISAHNGNANVSFYEMRFKASAGGVNLATGGSAFANTFYSAGYEAALAFDNSLSTRWAANGGTAMPYTIGYILPTAGIINQVEIVPEVTTNPPKDFIVQSSADGVTWVNEWAVAEAIGWVAGVARVFNRP